MNPHRASFSRQPLAQLAIVFSTGICIANYLPIRLLPWFIAGGFCSVVAVAALLNSKLAVAGAALLVATGCAGAALAVQERQDLPNDRLRSFFGKQVILTGVLEEPAAFGGDRLYLTLDVERLDENGSSRNVGQTRQNVPATVVSLSAPFRTETSEREYRDLQLHYGARIRVVATLNRGDEFRNPGVLPLSEYLERKGYDATGLVKSAAAITRLDDPPKFSLQSLLYLWREQLEQEIKTKFDSETGGVLDAALLGNRYNLSHDTAERFREGGTFHVLVISGLHISFIGGLVLLVMTRLSRSRWLQFVVPALFVWAYAFGVGAEASVVRAALMFTFGGLALVLFRESSSLNALGAATFLLLIPSPKEIFDPSFQLTFLAVLAIVTIAWPLLQKCTAIGAWYPSRETPYPPTCSRGLRWFCEVLFWSERKWAKEIARSPHRYRLFKTPIAARLEKYRVQWLLRYVFGAVVVSAGVQLVLLPLMIVYFHRLSPASLILNIVVSILLAILTGVALFALLVAQFSAALATPLVQLAAAINWLLIHSVDPFSRFHVASIRLPEYSGWGALVYVLYFVPLLVLVVTKRFVRPTVIAQTLLVVVLVLHPLSSETDHTLLRIDFLDVGQGDAALITLPDGRALLVDGGGAGDKGRLKTDKRGIGEAVVSEYLWWRGLDTIDYVLATHADADHIDGLNDVLRNFNVAAALVARSPANDPEFAKFAQTIAQTQTHVATIQAGDVIHFGDVTVQVLWPPPALEPNEPSRNNDSIVLRLTYGKREILLTGDIEKNAERALTMSATDLRADVVKVPHHGSKTSSTQPFVAATQAQTAIISVGQHSMFGHPHREVVERWQASGARVLTTGNCGTITVTTNGVDLFIAEMQSRTSAESPCPLAH